MNDTLVNGAVAAEPSLDYLSFLVGVEMNTKFAAVTGLAGGVHFKPP